MVETNEMNAMTVATVRPSRIPLGSGASVSEETGSPDAIARPGSW